MAINVLLVLLDGYARLMGWQLRWRLIDLPFCSSFSGGGWGMPPTRQPTKPNNKDLKYLKYPCDSCHIGWRMWRARLFKYLNLHFFCAREPNKEKRNPSNGKMSRELMAGHAAPASWRGWPGPDYWSTPDRYLLTKRVNVYFSFAYLIRYLFFHFNLILILLAAWIGKPKMLICPTDFPSLAENRARERWFR